EKFKDWLDQERKPAVDDDSVRSDKYVFLRQSCVNCHPVRGTENETSARKRGYAPDLTHLMNRKTLASGIIENDPGGKKLRDWVRDPQKMKLGCLMPAFGLNEKELDSVVNYLKTLR